MNEIIKSLFLTPSITLLFAAAVCAHPEHQEAPGETAATSAGGVVEISQEASKNLALVVAVAEVRSIDNTVSVIGQIEPIPAKATAITSRISGRIASLLALDGASVKRGDALVDVESRQVGDPPPHVKYTAPFDAIVLDRHVNQGDTVEPDNHLMEIADLTEVYAKGRVYEGQISSIKIGQQVRVLVESFPAETFVGKIELISGALDAQTRTLQIWVRIANPELKLRPNMRATLHIITAKSDSVIAIPRSAVLGQAGHSFVFVQDDKNPLHFERRAVVTGIQDDHSIEIIEGVLPDEKVVSTGNFQLQYVPATSPSGHRQESHNGAPDLTARPTSLSAKLGLIAIGGILSFIFTTLIRRLGRN